MNSHKPRLLDLFCGAGGAAVGYARAGFEVVGIDHVAQPHYPFKFVQADALQLLKSEWNIGDGWPFDAIHASPPCQASSRLRAMWPERDYPELIPSTRELLVASELPYVIENVEGAALINPVTLCGSMFSLRIERGWLRRHRLFECRFPISPPPCNHPPGERAVGVYGHGGHNSKPRMCNAAEAREAMGINWMNRDEMCQAVPPAYTAYVGHYLRTEIERRDG